MNSNQTDKSSSRFKVFHELMTQKVRRILLVSTSYEAWIMEEDCRLSEQIVHEYRGLNLSRPPQLSWVSSLSEVLESIEQTHFDLVITISRTVDSKAYQTGEEIKRIRPDMPVVLLTHQEVTPETYAKYSSKSSSIDQVFFWSGDAGSAKILLASSYEQAMKLYEQYKPYVLGVISDVRFPQKGEVDPEAGLKLLRHIKQDRFDIGLLLTSSEPNNAQPAAKIPAAFIDKNSRVFNDKLASVLQHSFGFGDFVFKLPDGSEIDRAVDLYALENKLRSIPEASFIFHWKRNDFSRWLFLIAEVELASKIRPLREIDFDSVGACREQLIKMIEQQRRDRFKGVIVDFDKERFDPETGFLKIGKGSLGDKARGLAFISSLLHRSSERFEHFDTVNIFVPQTLAITTEGFDAFIRMNHLEDMIQEELSDEVIAERFMAADFPETVRSQLSSYLNTIHYPLAVRSSSLLEDAQFKPYAGLYRTFFLANDHDDLDCRLDQLINAVIMVYASTYCAAPKAFSLRVGNRLESEKMAVMIQQVIGRRYGNFFYPAISGVAQSKNYYPFSKMKPEEGIVTIAMGLGKAVVEGEKNLRFSPRFPEISPQRSSVEDILANSQQDFYALKTNEPSCLIGIDESVNLDKRSVHDADKEDPVRLLSSTYFPEDNRIRDSFSSSGYPVLTFASVLKHRRFPLAEAITALLELGSKELGCPVEMEFAFDFPTKKGGKAQFAVLQIRPLSAREEILDVDISKFDQNRAFCISKMALGNTINREIKDIVYVKPDSFDPAKTVEIAKQIAGVNATLMKEGRKYLLIGPGRWGSADHWLGIPVTWMDICGVSAIVETTHPRINAEPSQGSHFFHNIAALGITYLNVNESHGDKMNFEHIETYTKTSDTNFIVHAVAPQSLVLKADGSRGLAVIVETSDEN